MCFMVIPKTTYSQKYKDYLVRKTEKAYQENSTPENEQAIMDARAIVVLVIGIYLASALLPSAISALNEANTSGWTTTQIAIWSVVSVVILAVVIMKLAE